MAKNSPPDPSTRSSSLFARRQVYLRTGQDSQYVELSPMLQIGTAIGFGALALWLIGASYGAATGYFDQKNEDALLARLGNVEQALEEAEKTRDAALDEAARVAELEAELAAVQTAAAEVPAADIERTRALETELEQTRTELDELQVRLSESRADRAALEARFEAEASATSDSAAKTTEEAASLHGQLEDAFADIDALEKERDEARARLADAEAAKAADAEATERNNALLKAATAEIERLQGSIAQSESLAETESQEREAEIARLEAEKKDVADSREELQRQVAELEAELETARSETAAADAGTAPEDTVAKAEFDAALEAQASAAERREADLLAQIDELRAEIAADADSNAVVAATETGDDVTVLRERVAAAEAEIERLILVGLNAENGPGTIPAVAEDPDEVERLRAELVAARADIIKLNADVKAAKQRLADKAVSDNVQAARTDNSAKLEQQLASTRSRVQQLNKALADAKLREVAIDLALISVVPSPSPPAPR